MIYLRDIPREFTRDQWRKLYRMMRKVGERGDIRDASLESERADFVARVRAVAESGKVCVVESGRDCDCVDFIHSSIRDANPLALWIDRESARDWADGPLWHSYVKPSERPDSYSRDLIAEAYENGHAHSVSSATI